MKLCLLLFVAFPMILLCARLAGAGQAAPNSNDQPFTPADVARGRQIFLGNRPLANGGSSCVSCHTVGTIDRVGGSQLGPDLTLAYKRFGGREQLSVWLASPPPGAMQTLYKDNPLTPEEVYSLVAFFEDAAEHGKPASAGYALKIFVSVMVAVLLLLFGLQAAWRRTSPPGRSRK